MDVAGLVIGAVGMVALWNNCVQAFDVVAAGRRYGHDYEVIRVKLEVERIRLLAWGEAVGLAQVQKADSNPVPLIDDRLNKENMRTTVLRLLGCIEHIFKDSNALERKYGLKPESLRRGEDAISLTDISTEGNQFILGSIFKHTYENLQKSAKNYSQNTPFKRKVTWAISDRSKFLALVGEIKGFNDSLVSLFPDVTHKANRAIHEEIDTSDEIRSLQLLQEAAADNHEDISDSASLRLNNLGATVMTELDDIKPKAGEAAAPVPHEARDKGQDQDKEEVDNEKIGLEKELDLVEKFVAERRQGSITCYMHMSDWSPRYRVSVYWQGDRHDGSFETFNDKLKGFVPSLHNSFDIYRRKKYTKKQRYDKYDLDTDEDYVLLDAEADPRYDNIRPGTVTIEGFGLECWNYQEVFGKKRDEVILVSAEAVPSIPIKKLLRRVEELKYGSTKDLAWNPKGERMNLQEFVGPRFVSRMDDSPFDGISDFYRLLNRTDIFVDFGATSSVILHLNRNGVGMANLLWQIIIGYELLRRLAHFPDAAISGFTSRILKTVIVADMWINNVRIVLAEGTAEAKEAIKKDAEKAKEEGNEAMKKENYKSAIDLYTIALDLTPKNPIYLSNRAAAYINIQEYELACEDAQAAVDADPKYSKGWGRLGRAKSELGDFQGSMDAYKRGMETDSQGGSAIMRQGYENAKKQLEAQTKEKGKKATEHVKKEEKPSEVSKKEESNPWDDAWDPTGKSMQLHSQVHEKQVEGLLRFAEVMKWPFMNETREYAEDVYGNFRSGIVVSPDIFDWIFGLVLPGKWAAYKIMATLVLCTPSLSKEIGTASYYDVGLSLQKQSYWRSRTVLGRVLGALPGVKSVCGWIGPCPPITGPHRKYIRLKSRWIAPPSQTSHLGSGYDPDDPIRPKETDDLEQYIAEIKDESRWAHPEPPVRQVTNCVLESISVKKLPLSADLVANSSKMSEAEIENETEYRASITFKIDNEAPVTYTLYTNPVFITPPTCKTYFGVHQAHMRELPKFHQNVWNVEDLKEAEAVDYEDNGVLIINATGRGAEVLARAWCSERGKSAVIRTSGGPCFSCAYTIASQKSLGVNVLIWVS